MKISKTFDVIYYSCPRHGPRQFSHTYAETWESCEHFCPHCGRREVMEAQGGGDYYVGVDYLCLACGWTFSLPGLHAPPTVSVCNDQEHQRLVALGVRPAEASHG